jgi:hypothetical protein
MNKFSNFKPVKKDNIIQKSLSTISERKIQQILNNLQIEIFDQNEEWVGIASIKGLKEAVEQLDYLMNKETLTTKKQILENCLNYVYSGNIKQIQSDIERLNEGTSEPEYWEADELGIDNDKVKSIFSQSGIILYDIDILDSKVMAYVDCPASGLGYDTVEALSITVDRLKSLEKRAESLGFLMKINPDPFISGKMLITLTQ